MPPKKKNKKKPTGSSSRKEEQESPGLLGRLFRLVVLLGIWCGIILTGVVAYYAIDLPDVREVAQAQRRPSITLLADNGAEIAHSGDLAGETVSLKTVPHHLVQAIMAIEDRRFYDHFGIDVFGVLRAMTRNVVLGRIAQGGSTITQQLAKNLFLSPERTFKRKVQEMLLALWLEKNYSKDQILTAYLNRVYLGAGAYGVDAAAQIYFNKPVQNINLRESATIAGLLRAPSRFSPTNDPSQAAARAETVLAAMEDAGYITKKERALASYDTPLPRRKPGAGGDGHYFVDWIVEQVGAILVDAPQDIVVSTTLDQRLQQAAERQLDAVLVSGAEKNVTQAALVSLAPDGAVRALVGGRDYDESQYNRVTQAMRQPGSAFKPVIYLAAIRKGLTPSDIFEDAPIKIGKWSPENYDGKYHGNVTARQAFMESLNTVAVRVLQMACVSGAVDTARAMGISSPIHGDLSLALGTNTLTPLELTSSYATLASGGRLITPYAIKEIRNRKGDILYRRPVVNPPVTLDESSVHTLVDMMTDVVREGTGRRAAIGRPVAGKTGTSSDYRDAWFVGFTADYVTGVWMGNDNNAPMKRVTGGSLPAELWQRYMTEAEAPLPVRDLLQEEWRPGKEEDTDSDILGDLIKSLIGE